MRLRIVFSSILLAITLFCGVLFIPTEQAYADTTPIILLTGKTVDGDILVDVNLKANEGISAMLLTLDYDKEKITLTGFERGDALNSLELVPTNPDGKNGYAEYPFKFYWEGEENDLSNGKILTLRFSPVQNAQGKAYVKFTYKNGEVNYIASDDVKTRNLLIDVLHIDLSKGKATDMESEITDPSQDNSNKTSLAVGLSLAGITIIALAIGLPILWRKKHK